MRFSELDGRAVAVWGLGRETRSLTRHLAERLPTARLAAVVSDERRPGALTPSQAASALDAGDVLVRSPGVSIHRPELRALRARGVIVTTATALWLAERGGRNVLGVTGTKGKSTTATLIAHLAAHDRPVELAGNIGRPALDLLDAPAETWVVLELSSYQIADLTAGPQVAVITNLYREHVDWHGDEATYRADKLRLFSLPGVEAAVHPAGSDEIQQTIEAAHVPRTLAFDPNPGLPPDQLPLRGAHNAANLSAALTALDAAGIPRPADLPRALDGLEPLPHRLQTVHHDHEIEWIDDSISTTPESALAALAAFAGRPVILIAGGHDRGQDHAQLAAALAARADITLISLPVTGPRLSDEAAAAGLAAERLAHAPDMATAVRIAKSRATPGTAVLLSPAAPSYNSYVNFEARGDHFAALASGAPWTTAR